MFLNLARFRFRKWFVSYPRRTYSSNSNDRARERGGERHRDWKDKEHGRGGELINLSKSLTSCTPNKIRNIKSPHQPFRFSSSSSCSSHLFLSTFLSRYLYAPLSVSHHPLVRSLIMCYSAVSLLNLCISHCLTLVCTKSSFQNRPWNKFIYLIWLSKSFTRLIGKIVCWSAHLLLAAFTLLSLLLLSVAEQFKNVHLCASVHIYCVFFSLLRLLLLLFLLFVFWLSIQIYNVVHMNSKTWCSRHQYLDKWLTRTSARSRTHSLARFSLTICGDRSQSVNQLKMGSIENLRQQ